MKKRPEPKHPGDILKQARVKAGFSRHVVIARLGVTGDVFAAIEDWQLESLPDNPHLIPILKRHATIVGTEYAVLGEKFPEALQRQPMSEDPPVSTLQPARSVFVLSSVMKALAVLCIVGLVVGYVAWQGSSLGSRPKLEVAQQTNQIVSVEVMTINGVSSEGSQVFVNGTSVLVDEHGSFEVDVVLQNGPNNIVIRAVNNVGAEREEVLVIVRE